MSTPIQTQNPQNIKWLDRTWSQWIGLEDALKPGYGPLHQPGIYRIRNGKLKKSLLYIGISRDIRGRLFQLKNAMKKYNRGDRQSPPHWAGGCIRTHELRGDIIEVSWLQSIDSELERKGLECDYIAAHRWFCRSNPECQFVSLDRRNID